jgi:hypothetical protein
MQVEINHPHAEAIAAFYNGRRIRSISYTGHPPWMKLGVNNPLFSPENRYEIEPEVKVKYNALLPTLTSGTTINVAEFSSIEDLKNSPYLGNRIGIVKKTYTEGVLTAIEIMKE